MPLFIGTIRNQNTKLHQWEPILPRQSYQPKIFQLSKNHISPRQDDIFIDQKYIPRYGKEKRHFWVQIELDLMANIADFHPWAICPPPPPSRKLAFYTWVILAQGLLLPPFFDFSTLVLLCLIIIKDISQGLARLSPAQVKIGY